MSEIRVMLEETVTRLFGEQVTTERIATAEKGVWLGELWDTLEQTGLTRPHLAEDVGGAGGTWLEAFVIARAAGRHCVPLPVVETMLAGWLLAQAGVPVPDGPSSVAPTPLAGDALASDTITAELEAVPWGRHVRHVVVTAERGGRTVIAAVPVQGARVSHGCNVALEPRDTLGLTNHRTAGSGEASVPAAIVEQYGAMLRAAQMAGALEAILEMAVRYATERVQFGRPIAKFQAIQHELARLAGWVAEAGCAAEVACRAAAEGGDPSVEIAAAKVVVGEAAEHGPRIAHQVHGAIGFTYEHALHFATRRLWAWRAEFGTPERWADRLGERTLAAGADALWPWVTSR